MYFSHFTYSELEMMPWSDFIWFHSRLVQQKKNEQKKIEEDLAALQRR